MNISSTRDYNRAIKISIEFYNKDAINILPETIRNFFERVQTISEVAAAKRKKDIEFKLQKLKDFLKFKQRRKRLQHN